MTELATTTQASFSLVPASFDEATKIADYLAKSELVPKDYFQKPANIVVAMAWGSEVGLQPLQALQNIAVINGRGSIWGDAALALCMSRSEFEDIHEEIQGDGEHRVAVCTVKRKGRTQVTRKFSVEDARKAGLWQTQARVTRRKKDNQGTYEVDNDSPWWKYPERMLQMRARGFALRDSFPDAMRGLYLAEELQGDPIERDITPAAARPEIVTPTATASTTQKSSKAKAKTEEPEPVDAEFTVDQSTGEILGQQPADEPAPQAPVVEGVQTASDGMLKVIRAKLKSANLTEADLAKAFGADRIEAIPATDVNKAMDWIKNGGAA